jgi:signal transduction histidine kinase
MELAANLPPVMGDRVQLQQVVLNLILNAIEAMSTVEDRERVLVIGTQRGEGDEVRVAVQDSGIGLDPKNVERILMLSILPNPTAWAWGYRFHEHNYDLHRLVLAH